MTKLDNQHQTAAKIFEKLDDLEEKSQQIEIILRESSKK